MCIYDVTVAFIVSHTTNSIYIYIDLLCALLLRPRHVAHRLLPYLPVLVLPHRHLLLVAVGVEELLEEPLELAQHVEAARLAIMSTTWPHAIIYKLYRSLYTRYIPGISCDMNENHEIIT